MKLLFNYFVDNTEEIPPPYFRPGTNPERASVDYVAGMTDHYARKQFNQLFGTGA